MIPESILLSPPEEPDGCYNCRFWLETHEHVVTRLNPETKVREVRFTEPLGICELELMDALGEKQDPIEAVYWTCGNERPCDGGCERWS